MKKITVLGVTGSIGMQTVDVAMILNSLRLQQWQQGIMWLRLRKF